MAYDEFVADRLRNCFGQRGVAYEEKHMMGGLVFMVDEKMCVAVKDNKETKQPQLMVRIGKEAYETAIKEEGARDMDITGTIMKGFVYVEAEGFDEEERLDFWVDMALAYNPFAQKSKKRAAKA